MTARATAIGKRMRRVILDLAAKGCRTDLVMLPANMKALKRKYTADDERFLRAMHRESGFIHGDFGVLDLTSRPHRVVMDVGPDGDYLLDDPHYTVSGHRKIAAAVARWWQTSVRDTSK